MPHRENKQEFMERHVIGQTGRGIRRRPQTPSRAPQSQLGEAQATPDQQQQGDTQEVQLRLQTTPNRSRAGWVEEHAEQSEGQLGNPNSQQI